jgi:uncharacterized flavoprotein (TIGR03862 family)
MNLSIPVAVVGGGPAGLMAAQVLQDAGLAVHVFDAMPSVGRKFLLAGKGGLNLTHSEGPDTFAGRYGARRDAIERVLKDFDATALREWARSLGVETFVGTSGRVFPKDMKAAPLLRAWLHRLRHPAQGLGVQFHMRHRWTGWGTDNSLQFDTPHGPREVKAGAVVLALGGGSWARLGSDGAWVPLLAQKGVAVAPLLPSNCGFDVQGGWSEHFKSKFAGQPFKSVAISLASPSGAAWRRKGEFVATQSGVEGSLIYAASAQLREEIIKNGRATFTLDLLPDMSADKVLQEVSHPRGSRSLSSHLKSRLNLDGIKAAILHEMLDKTAINDSAHLAAAIKSLPITVQATRPIDEAISSAGGVLFEVLNAGHMLEQLPGVFCAGEMLDWEAPTGGYLLHASFATGRAAGRGVLEWLGRTGAPCA